MVDMLQKFADRKSMVPAESLQEYMLGEMHTGNTHSLLLETEVGNAVHPLILDTEVGYSASPFNQNSASRILGILVNVWQLTNAVLIL